MQAQDLFQYADTSREVYEKKVEPHIKDIHILILRKVANSVDGITPDEYADDFHDGNFSYIRPRFTELYKQGLLELCEWRRENRRGNNCRCYKLSKWGYKIYLQNSK